MVLPANSYLNENSLCWRISQRKHRAIDFLAANSELSHHVSQASQRSEDYEWKLLFDTYPEMQIH